MIVAIDSNRIVCAQRSTIMVSVQRAGPVPAGRMVVMLRINKAQIVDNNTLALWYCAITQRLVVQSVETQEHHALLNIVLDSARYEDSEQRVSGEIRRMRGVCSEKVALFAPVPLPDKGNGEPWRLGVSYLYYAFGEALWDCEIPLLKSVSIEKIRHVLDTISSGSAPLVSDMDCFLDGIAAIAGFEHFHGMETAMKAFHREQGRYGCEWKKEGRSYVISPVPLIWGVVTDREQGVSSATIGGKVYSTLIGLFVDLCGRLKSREHIDHVTLSGNSSQHAYLRKELARQLTNYGFRVKFSSAQTCRPWEKECSPRAGCC